MPLDPDRDEAKLLLFKFEELAEADEAELVVLV
jgi:hypothetical protein